VVVLGHSGCGAVTAAVDVFLEPTRVAATFTMRSVLDRPLLAIQFAAQALSRTFGSTVAERPGYRDALIELSVLTNAAFAAYSLQRNLTDLAAEGVRAVYGVYLLETREVWAPHDAGGGGGTWLADPPRDMAEFIALAEAGIASPRIAGLLAA
jgi:carbonic anhydrase